MGNYNIKELMNDNLIEFCSKPYIGAKIGEQWEAEIPLAKEEDGKLIVICKKQRV